MGREIVIGFSPRFVLGKMRAVYRGGTGGGVCWRVFSPGMVSAGGIRAENIPPGTRFRLWNAQRC